MITYKSITYYQSIKCQHCGKDCRFESHERQLRSTRKYCSYTCRKNAYIIKQAENLNGN